MIISANFSVWPYWKYSECLSMKLETQQPVPQTEVPGSIPETVVAVDLAKRIVGSGLQTDAFLLANEDQLLKNCAKLAKDFKGVLPYFGKLKNFQNNRETKQTMYPHKMFLLTIVNF